MGQEKIKREELEKYKGRMNKDKELELKRRREWHDEANADCHSRAFMC